MLQCERRQEEKNVDEKAGTFKTLTMTPSRWEDPEVVTVSTECATPHMQCEQV
jgi:hypothetical protein